MNFMTDSTVSTGFNNIPERNKCHRKYWYPTHQHLNLRTQMLLAAAEDSERDTRALITNSCYTVTCLHLNTCHPVRQFAHSHLTQFPMFINKSKRLHLML
jgi:hypothetical protein